MERDKSPRAKLYRLLTDHFSLGEIKTVAFHLQIDYENYSDNKEDMARELILDCERRDRIDDLIKAIQHYRQDIHIIDAGANPADEQDEQAQGRHSTTIPAFWPSEIRCKSCGELIRIIELDDHLANGIELTQEEYDFIPQEDEVRPSGDWIVNGFIVCRNCGRKLSLLEKHIEAYVHDNYTCTHCKQKGHMTPRLLGTEASAVSLFVRRVKFMLTCENCNHYGIRRKLLRFFNNIESLLINNSGIQVKRSPGAPQELS